MADGDGNVTMAVVADRLSTLTEKVSESIDDAREDRKEQAKVNKDINTRVTRLETRMGIWGAVLATFGYEMVQNWRGLIGGGPRV